MSDKADRILNDPEWNKRVVEAAIEANGYLWIEPIPSEPLTSARTLLNTALIDMAELKRKLLQ